MTVGIGANTAIFSVIHTVLLKPLPYPDPDRILQLISTSPSGKNLDVSLPKFAQFQQEKRVFSEMAAYQSGAPGLMMTGNDRSEQLRTLRVSSGYFALFGLRVARGRTFSSEEDRPGGPHQVVLSYGAWVNHFARDPEILGRAVLLGGEPHVVIGVLTPDAPVEPPVDVWLPLQAETYSRDHTNQIRVAARMAPGVSLLAVRRAMGDGTVPFRRTFPGALGPYEYLGAITIWDAQLGDVRPALFLIGAAVGAVLLIACGNLVHLLLARASKRAREMAIRAALGASRRRLVVQLLIESFLLAVGGGALGIGFAWVLLRAILVAGAGMLPRLNGMEAGAITLDRGVLLFTAGLSAVTGILFGILPAWSASQIDLSAAFKEGGAQQSTGPRQSRQRGALVVMEMALAMVLLVGAGLLLRTYQAVRQPAKGIATDHVLTLQMSLQGSPLERTGSLNAAIEDVERRVSLIAGVAAVSMTSAIPTESGLKMPFTISQRPLLGSPYHGTAQWQSVSWRYFDVFRMRVRAGQGFTSYDGRQSTPVMVINDAMARRFFPGRNPLGELVKVGEGMSYEWSDPARRVVGVVMDGRDNQPTVYVPAVQLSDGLQARTQRLSTATWVVRTQVPPHRVSGLVQQELRVATQGLPVGQVRSMDDVLAGATARAAFHALLISTFAMVAVLLAGVGLYGVIAYSVQERNREIGVRMAVGAGSAEIRGMVLRDGLRLAGIGVAIGLPAAVAVSRLMVSLIYGVKSWDPLVLAGVAGVLMVISLAASYVPARRATKVDPLITLRAGS